VEKMTDKITGSIHSIETLGTLDGGGIRFVIFLGLRHAL